MASKRKTREQIRAKRERQKKNEVRKAAFMRSIIMRKFQSPKITKHDFGDDNFEFLLADDRYQNDLLSQRKREILFRRF